MYTRHTFMLHIYLQTSQIEHTQRGAREARAPLYVSPCEVRRYMCSINVCRVYKRLHVLHLCLYRTYTCRTYMCRINMFKWSANLQNNYSFGTKNLKNNKKTQISKKPGLPWFSRWKEFIFHSLGASYTPQISPQRPQNRSPPRAGGAIGLS